MFSLFGKWSLTHVRDLHAAGETFRPQWWRRAVAPGPLHPVSTRNVVGERVLGFPREPAPDRGVPFNQVKRNKN